MRKIGIGASIGAILSLGPMAAGGHPYDTLTPYKRDRSNEPKFRLPPTPLVRSLTLLLRASAPSGGAWRRNGHESLRADHFGESLLIGWMSRDALPRAPK